MAVAYPMESRAIPDLERALPEGEHLPEEESLPNEEPLPEALRAIMMKPPMRLLCLFALGRLDLEDHWKSLQSDEAFGSTITIASTLTVLSGGFKATGSVNYFDYTSPASYLAFFATLMFALTTILISCLSAKSWLHADRHRAQEQLKQGGYHVVSYLLSIFAPMLSVALSLTCFIGGEFL
ncbi:hypothetical protein EDB19DRAFT_1736846, partial [Suillus lakei]